MQRKRINLPLLIDDNKQILGAFPTNYYVEFDKLSKLSTDVTAPAVYYRKSFIFRPSVNFFFATDLWISWISWGYHETKMTHLQARGQGHWTVLRSSPNITKIHGAAWYSHGRNCMKQIATFCVFWSPCFSPTTKFRKEWLNHKSSEHRISQKGASI